MEVSLYEVEGISEITALRGLLGARGQLIGLSEAEEFSSINCFGIKSTLKSNDTKPSFLKGCFNRVFCFLTAY
jgi:hypothetical protein